MTKEQQRRYDELCLEYGIKSDLTPGLKSLIYTLACIEIEEQELQEYIDEYGTCYCAPSGHDKQRPQWQQLRDNRQRKTTIVATLERKAGVSTESEESVDEYFG
jgi:hypothetical protein